MWRAGLHSGNTNFLISWVGTDTSVGRPDRFPKPVRSTPPPILTLDIQRLNAGEYRITWSGTDAVSGIAGYDLDLQTDDGVWVAIRSNTFDTIRPSRNSG
ncbi:MAG: hypothetical protein ACOYYS_14010 [Chloroflexota bacterium]